MRPLEPQTGFLSLGHAQVHLPLYAIWTPLVREKVKQFKQIVHNGAGDLFVYYMFKISHNNYAQLFCNWPYTRFLLTFVTYEIRFNILVTDLPWTRQAFIGISPVVYTTHWFVIGCAGDRKFCALCGLHKDQNNSIQHKNASMVHCWKVKYTLHICCMNHCKIFCFVYNMREYCYCTYCFQCTCKIDFNNTKRNKK